MLEAGAVLVKEAGGKRLQGSVGQQRRPSADEGGCHRVLEEADGCRAFACARSLAKLAASSLHLPPVAMPRTRSPHRRLRMRSGYVTYRRASPSSTHSPHPIPNTKKIQKQDKNKTHNQINIKIYNTIHKTELPTNTTKNKTTNQNSKTIPNKIQSA